MLLYIIASIIQIISFIIGFYCGRAFINSPKSFNPFSIISDKINTTSQSSAASQVRIISPSKKAQDKKLEKDLNENL